MPIIERAISPEASDAASSSVSRAEGGACCTRRGFLGGAAGSCGAWIFFALAGSGAMGRRVFAAGPDSEIVGTEPFARVEKLGEGIWAVVSTPIDGDRTTMSNGGIIVGRDAVLVVEGFNTFAGGAWMSKLTEQLTGRRPTHVILTHHHPDHSNGLAGHLRDGQAPSIISRAQTRNLMAARSATFEGQKDEANPSPFLPVGQNQLLPNTVIADETEEVELDLGGRTVRLVSRLGHTPSDLTIEISDPRVVWCGDLVFNGFFPFFGDAIPSKLGETCRGFLRDPDTTYVPGHGVIADAEGLKPYLGLLDAIEEAARDYHAKGISAEEASHLFKVPPSLGEWMNVRPDRSRHAFVAWERELRPAE
jgi:glyoxylase-like metal-dependent hydrolase (beta-lactamase superfamily II)